MSKKVKHKGGQYCPRCRTNVMAVNDTSFFGSGWCCPNCGEHTVGPLLRSAIQKKERQAVAAPRYNVTCVYGIIMTSFASILLSVRCEVPSERIQAAAPLGASGSLMKTAPTGDV